MRTASVPGFPDAFTGTRSSRPRWVLVRNTASWVCRTPFTPGVGFVVSVRANRVSASQTVFFLLATSNSHTRPRYESAIRYCVP